MRNRDYWTVNAISPGGDLLVTRIDGHGTVTLPNSYVTEHVQLGYAATEPGNQSETADRSVTLASGATTCQGLYVGATRGRDENMIHVVTETHDLGEAVDMLQRILGVDRSDLPAIAARRELAATVPPTPTLSPRCEIPDWYHDLHNDTRRAVVDAGATIDEHEHTRTDLTRQITQLDRQLEQHAPSCAPHDHAIALAEQAVEDACRNRQRAVDELAHAGQLHKRSARHDVERAAKQINKQQVLLDKTRERARPVLDRRDEITRERDERHRQQAINTRTIHAANGKLQSASNTLHALTTWHDWAAGHEIPNTKLVDAATELHSRCTRHANLAAPLLDWCEQRGLITRERPQPEINRAPQRPSRGIEIDF